MLNRRITALVLVVVMLFSFTVNAFAANAVLKDQIIEKSEFKVSSYEGKKTVSIIVHLEEYPELAQLDMLYSVTQDLYALQAEYADDSFVLMDKQHIAGELALHAFFFKIVYMLGGDNEYSPLHDYFLSFKDAELNIDEARLDSSLIAFAGKIVLTLGIDISEVITDGIENVLDQNTDAEAEVEAEVA